MAEIINLDQDHLEVVRGAPKTASSPVPEPALPMFTLERSVRRTRLTFTRVTALHSQK